MVSISHESIEETERRLKQVIQSAKLVVYDQEYAFAEFALSEFPNAINAEALALVRDDNVWSQLLPCTDPDEERFALFRFHFPAGADNSGFVGWLAGHLKRRFGTGVFVICGQNRNDGGIFDYWGVPSTVAHEAISEVRNLVRG
ncbi:DUF6196 family protein [Sphingopyxis kveilinensis]|uniref:DUF6196 family protein n=1 Tax=Sphingopyxis kveilinensis TaxID=3114367 RepID=UPI0030D5E902